MSNRISAKQLEELVRLLNKLTDSPTEPWTGRGDTFRSNPGCYHIEHAYGQPRLCRIVGEHGGTSDISPRLPNGELFRWIHAYIDGVQAKRGAA